MDTTWICQTDPSHQFSSEEAEANTYFCPTCDANHEFGLLIEDKIVAQAPAPIVPEIGLSVILMDASSSMTDPAFDNAPMSRMRLVAESCARGLFDLDRMQNNPNAFVAIYKFDDRVKLILLDTVANLINRFSGDTRKFADFLYEELFEMQQGTDINQALKEAYGLIKRFMEKKLDIFPIQDYTIMKQVVFTYDHQSKSIPNIRLLIYTDGMQFVENGLKFINFEQFKFLGNSQVDKLEEGEIRMEDKIVGLDHNIVIGAYFGKDIDDGAKQLKTVVGKCPIHDTDQFFLFTEPKDVSILKNLFRMASGASGFCETCLNKEI